MNRRAASVLILLTSLIGIFAAPSLVEAHEVRPGYLEIRQRSAEVYDVLWKVPARGDMSLRLEVLFSEPCSMIGPPVRMRSGGALVDRWSIRCPGGLVGNSISIEGLSDSMTDVLVRIEHEDGIAQITLLTPSKPTFTVEAQPGALRVAATYTALGIEHIVLGVDHLLFVLALLLIVGGGRALVKTVTAFTVAHSITLALASLGAVHLPGPPVEAAIALSIVFVASEIVRRDPNDPGLTERRPWIVAFAFGLLHGFGFAGALSDIGLPPGDIPLALLTFNVGVEIGQLAFVLVALAAWTAVRRLAKRAPEWAGKLLPYGIGVIAAYWTIDQVVGFMV